VVMILGSRMHIQNIKVMLQLWKGWVSLKYH
jgi:hypothetical protein